MKKHLFLIASVFAAVSLQAQTAVVNVASDTGVRINENTLFYVGGEMKVADYTNPDKKVSNRGKVKITGKLVNENQKNGQEDGSNFVNEFPAAGKYGQLIINSDTSKKNVGKITSVVKFNPSFNFQMIALPYAGVKAEGLVKEAFGRTDVSSAFIEYTGNGAYQESRFRNPLFYWNNDTYTTDNLSATADLVPGLTYVISDFSSLGELSKSNKTKLTGKPYKDDFSVEVTGYVPGPFNKSANKYGEAYGSYITDFVTPKPAGWGDFHQKGGAVKNVKNYGANVYYLGNPYTSNINLAKGEGFTTNGVVEAIYQAGSNEYRDDKTSAAADYTITNASTAVGAGDNNIHVRPFQTFALKLKLKAGTKHNFTFNSAMKTFDGFDSESKDNVLFSKNRGSMPVINQVGLDLYDANGFTGVKTYVVASDIYEAAQQGQGTEVYNIDMGAKDTGVYTLQESEDGTVSEALADSKTYINGINADKYIAKPVHLVFQNGKGQYTLKARLNESLKNNKNAFYFEDKSTGKVQKVTEDFEYTFNINGTEKNRFVLYWAATPNNEKVEEVAKQEVSTTVVFKDADTYKVRFDKEIKKADVFVYNISGQLVNIARNINTSLDYIVPLKGNSSVYIVKVVGDNGQVTTKKIIK